MVLLRIDSVARPAERGTQHAVHELVGIPPDGGGEVRVQGEREPRVTVLRVRHAARAHVAGGGQQARHEVLEEVAEGWLGRRRRREVVEGLAEAGGGAAVEGEAPLLERELQPLQAVLGGGGVPAQQRSLGEGADDLRGDGGVGEDHPLFDELVDLQPRLVGED